MKFTAYYIDDQANSLVLHANSAQAAAWRFVAQHPRTDTSQVTVESHPANPRHPAAIAHYRACDIVNTPEPPDDPEPELALRLVGGPEPTYIVSGSLESLQALGTRLLGSLAENQPRPDPLGRPQVYGVPIVPADGSRLDHFFSFEIDPDLEQYRVRQRGLRGMWVEYGRILIRLGIYLLAGIGIWTVARWIF